MLRNLICLKSLHLVLKNELSLLRTVKGVGSRLLSVGQIKNCSKVATTLDANKPETTTKSHANPFARETLPQQTNKLPPLSAETATQSPNNSTKADSHVDDVSVQNPFAHASSAHKDDGFYAEGGKEPAPQMSDTERERRLKVLQLEADIAYQEGRRVPNLEFFELEHWQQLLAMPTKSSRIKYYAFLWQLQNKKESKARKKVERAAGMQDRIVAKKKEREENKHIIYGLADTSMFLRIYDTAINFWLNNRLTRAMQFAPKIVLDCSYDEYMTRREASNAAKQLMLCFADNRAHDDPFDLHYCNVNMNSHCIHTLKKFIPTMLNPEFPMNVHEKCFTELFPHENLVYLTPHCRTDLEAYNADDVYIIGAMVDKINNEPLSLAKAKKLKLRMARLPLDHYLQWGAGSGKSLTLDQMIKIMLDLKRTGDWHAALKHVPRRKIMNSMQQQQQQRQYTMKRSQQLDVRINQIFDQEQPHTNQVTTTSRPPVRTRKDQLQFNLDSWAAKKKSNNS